MQVVHDLQDEATLPGQKRQTVQTAINLRPLVPRVVRVGEVVLQPGKRLTMNAQKLQVALTVVRHLEVGEALQKLILADADKLKS